MLVLDPGWIVTVVELPGCDVEVVPCSVVEVVPCSLVVVPCSVVVG
jgi:hypothetical protein